VNGSSNLNLTAPSGGPTAGLLFGSSSGSATFSGDSRGLDGAIYVPNGSVTMSGNATSGTSNCFMVVANTVTFQGNSSNTFANSGCGSLGVPNVYDLPGIVRLIV
jgi:hypothetical protein